MSILKKYYRVVPDVNTRYAPDVYRLRIKGLMGEAMTRPEVKDLAMHLDDIIQRHDRVVNLLYTVLQEAQKLEVENEFMLKLINEHRIAE